MRTLFQGRSLVALCTSTSLFRAVLPITVMVFSFGGTAFLSGCGSGGSGGPNPTPTPTSVNPRSVTAGFDLNWAAATGIVTPPAIPASVSSLRVTLHGAGVDGSDVTVVVNRRQDRTDAYFEHIDFPVPVRVANGLTLEVQFYTEVNATGDSVGTTSATVSIQSDGSGIGTITINSRIVSTKVLPQQSVLIGKPTDILFEARDVNGALVPVSRGAATIRVAPTDSSRLISLGGNRVQGQLPGSASVTVSIDGVVSIPETIIIRSDTNVSLTPAAITITVQSQQQFTAGVLNAPDTTVVWSVREGANGGNISPTGLYTAPTRRGVFHIDAVSTYDTSKIGSATVTVNPGLTIDPPTATVTLAKQQTFTASVIGLEDTGVTWSVQEGASGGTITSEGVYTAPNQPGTYHLIATSREDTSVQATVTITVQAGSGTIIIE
jgi:hypothetical protein